MNGGAGILDRLGSRKEITVKVLLDCGSVLCAFGLGGNFFLIEEEREKSRFQDGPPK